MLHSDMIAPCSPDSGTLPEGDMDYTMNTCKDAPDIGNMRAALGLAMRPNLGVQGQSIEARIPI